MLVVACAVAWAASPMPAEPAPLAAAAGDGVAIDETPDGVVLTPDAPSGLGIALVAGARVDPAAYAARFADVARAGTTVVLARPILNFAIVDGRPLSTFTSLAPEVRSWIVGGHSLGGVRACRHALEADAAGSAVAGLLLVGSYCADDVSSLDLPVLSLGGGLDGLSTPQKIADAAHLLPGDARFAELAGASHASFGDYGAQPGDGSATVDDAEMTAWVTSEIAAWLPAPPPR